MKLATYNDGSRDGQLIVVSRDLATAHYASVSAQRLQQVLDDWNFVSPQLEDLYQTLNHGKARHAFPFNPAQCMAPLPRAFQWAVPASAAEAADLVNRPSDRFFGAREMVVLDAGDGFGLDFDPALAVAAGDIRAGASADAARDGVRLLLLASGWFRHRLDVPAHTARTDAAPLASAFGPVAVTPDELGDGWREDRLQLKVLIDLNGQKFARIALDHALPVRFGDLLARLAAWRDLRAGSLLGSGVLAGVDGGFANIAGKRAVQQERDGAASATFMGTGDSVRIEVVGPDGQSVFGSIEQNVAPRG